MGGPSGVQQAAAGQQLSNSQQEGQLANQSAQKFNSLYSQTSPFYSAEQNRGLPFFNNMTDYAAGDTARAFAPAQGDLNRRLAATGYLPSGFRTAAQNDLEAQKGKAFDSNLINAQMANFQAKQQGAAGNAGLMQAVNPASFYGGSSSAASSAMQPLQPAYNPYLGLAGGAVQGAASALPW